MPPMIDDPDLGRRLGELYAEMDDRFEMLFRAAQLSPARDFRARDLRALHLADADLRGFDFTDSDLRGAGLRLARYVDRSTVLTGAVVDEYDAAWITRTREDVDADRVELARDLRRAIDRQQFALVFQPKVSLKAGTVTGVEALLRWQHPDRGSIAPTTFVPLLEDLDPIGAATWWTIEAAIEQQRTLRHRGFDLAMSINVSPKMLGRRDFLADCRRLLDGDPVRLHFEISETVLIADPDTVREHIDTLAAMGVSIAIDDYGAGFSSLAVLKTSGASELKIDGSFVRRIDGDGSDPLIVRSSIDLAHALDMEVTADGVETDAQLKLLTVMGCDAAQGFFISRPLALDALIAWLKANPTVAVTVASRTGKP